MNQSRVQCSRATLLGSYGESTTLITSLEARFANRKREIYIEHLLCQKTWLIWTKVWKVRLSFCNAESALVGLKILLAVSTYIYHNQCDNSKNEPILQLKPKQNTEVQSIELQGKRSGTGKSHWNNLICWWRSPYDCSIDWQYRSGPVKWGKWVKWAAKVMSPWRGGTGIAKIAGAAPLMTVQLIAIKGAVPSKIVPPAKVVHPRGHHYSRCHPPCLGFSSIK